MKSLRFEIEKDGKEYHTWCPDLPGCHSHGKTVREAMENLKDAVSLYWKTLMEEQITLKSLKLNRQAV